MQNIHKHRNLCPARGPNGHVLINLHHGLCMCIVKSRTWQLLTGRKEALYADWTTTYSSSVFLLRKRKNAQLTRCGRRRQLLSPDGVDPCRRNTPRVHNMVIIAVVLIFPVVQIFCGSRGGSGRRSGGGFSHDRW